MRVLRRTAATVSSTVAEVLPERAHGNLKIQNNGAVPVYIGFGEEPAATTSYWAVYPGETHGPFESDQAVYAITASSTAVLVMYES